MKNNIVFVADIADDIDDLIAIEYLVVNGYLRCLVLDGKSHGVYHVEKIISEYEYRVTNHIVDFNKQRIYYNE